MSNIVKATISSKKNNRLDKSFNIRLVFNKIYLLFMKYCEKI